MTTLNVNRMWLPCVGFDISLQVTSLKLSSITEQIVQMQITWAEFGQFFTGDSTVLSLENTTKVSLHECLPQLSYNMAGA